MEAKTIPVGLPIEYRIIEARMTKYLNASVNNLLELNEGWAPLGRLIVLPHNDWFIQPMVRYPLRPLSDWD